MFIKQSGHQSLEKGSFVKTTNERRLKSMMNVLLEHSFKRVASWLDIYPLNFPSSCLHFYKLMRIIRW